MVRKKSRIKKAIRGAMPVSYWKPFALGNAFGTMSVVALVFYALMTWFSEYSAQVVILKFPIAFSFTSWTLIIGLIQGYVLGYITGWIVAKVYNKSLKS